MMFYKTKFILPLFFFSSLPMLSYASVCDSEKTVQHLLKQTAKHTERSFYDCRALPHQAGFSMLALAQFVPDQDEEYMGEYFIHLYKINDKTQKIVAQFKDPESYISDAVRFSEIKLDTAAYQLTPNIRAIGVRFGYEGPSRVSPYSSTNLNLYDFEHQKVLLNLLSVDVYRGENNGNCTSEWEEHNGILHILGTKSRGYADIRMTVNIKSEGMEQGQEDCIDLPTKYDKASFVMKYDGERYQVPKPFKELYTY